MYNFHKKEAPLLGLLGSGGGLASRLTGSAAASLYVDDVFSTFLYDGNGSARSITNGIDLAGEGGMVWFKARNAAQGHYLFDTERGHAKALFPDGTSGEVNLTNGLAAFESDGYSLNTGSSQTINASSNEYASWSFRKAPGFFDIVTYTGNESNPRQIAHNLGSVPGMIIVKSLSTSNWYVYHRSLNNGSNPGNYRLRLELTNGTESGTTTFGATATSTHFTISTNCNYANNYVAYLFAHDDQSFGTNGDEAIIKCGSYTGSTSSSIEVDLGFEPQYVMIKQATGSTTVYSNWAIFDNMRGINTGSNDPVLAANLGAAEGADPPATGDFLSLTATGFIVDPGLNRYQLVNANATSDYIYIAIRRPNKPPEAGTEVFATDTWGGGPPAFTSGFPVDLGIYKRLDGAGGNWTWANRLVSGKELGSNLNTAETTDASIKFDYQDGWYNNSGTYSNYQGWMFRRAPGFFDVVTYTGTGSARTVSHNLGVVPEMIIAKQRTVSSNDWYIYHESMGNTRAIYLNYNSQQTNESTAWWNNTSPTSSVFTVGTAPANNNTFGFIAYLFATLPGISKVGSYSGTGSDINVDCGFTNGARFVLIKRTDNTGDWYVYDSTRGIVSGNDPYLLLNDPAAQVTNTDYIDPLNSGFTVTSSAPDALNTDGGTYLFLAIA